MKVKNAPIKKVRTKEFSGFISGPTKWDGSKFCSLIYNKYNGCKPYLCENKNNQYVPKQSEPLDLSVVTRLDCSTNKALHDVNRNNDTLNNNTEQYRSIVSEQSEPLDLSLNNVQSCSSFINSDHRSIYHTRKGVSEQTNDKSIEQFKQSNNANRLNDNISCDIYATTKEPRNCLLEQWDKQGNQIDRCLNNLHNTAHKNNLGNNYVQTELTMNYLPERCNKQLNNAKRYVNCHNLLFVDDNTDNVIEQTKAQPTNKPVEQCEQRYKALYLYKIFTESFPTSFENFDGLTVNNINVNNININNLNNVADPSGNKVHFDEKLNCLYCKKFFWTSWELKKHMAVTFVRNNLTNKFHCCACAKTFAQKRYLQYHKRTHLDGIKFSCEFCSRKYTRSDNLARHNNFHINPNKFSCLYCDKKFVRKDLMNKHLRVHENKFRYECTSCKRFFRGPISFENHNKIYHNL